MECHPCFQRLLSALDVYRRRLTMGHMGLSLKNRHGSTAAPWLSKWIDVGGNHVGESCFLTQLQSTTSSFPSLAPKTPPNTAPKDPTSNHGKTLFMRSKRAPNRYFYLGDLWEVRNTKVTKGFDLLEPKLTSIRYQHTANLMPKKDQLPKLSQDFLLHCFLARWRSDCRNSGVQATVGEIRGGVSGWPIHRWQGSNKNKRKFES